MKISLEQWQIFKTIVDEGSFAAAAESLNKSQSGISYAMQQMAMQLPVPVFNQQGRKAELTELGKTLYRHAETLLKQAQDMENLARDMAEGIASEIAIAVDALTPQTPLFEGLLRFSEQCPRTRVKIYETTLSGTDEALLFGRAAIAIMGRVPPGFLGDLVAQVQMIPVAASDHDLAKRSAVEPISESELKRQRQIIIRDSGLKREQDAGWLGAEQRWTFSHFATSINAVKAGLGFAFLPSHRIQQELADHSLESLSLQNGGSRQIPLYLVQASPEFAGPTVTLAVKALRQAFLNYM
jgi:DNA-binding transcriptional LysR family regulator